MCEFCMPSEFQREQGPWAESPSPGLGAVSPRTKCLDSLGWTVIVSTVDLGCLEGVNLWSVLGGQLSAES